MHSPLPPYTGPHRVGLSDLSIPISPSRVTHPALKVDNQRPAFELSKLDFSIFYPCDPKTCSSSPPPYWLPQPVLPTASGWARFAGLRNRFSHSLFAFGAKLVVGSATVPALMDPPMLQPKSEDREWPVIVFSHGMASGRRSYTGWCGEMASRGVVVAVVEHGDGSAPASFMEQSEIRVDGREVDKEEWKRAQLGLREVEMLEMVRVLKAINEGMANGDGSLWSGKDLKSWTGGLNLRDVTLAGHSYGATTTFQILKGGWTEERPFKGAIVMDPGKNSGRFNEDIRCPMLIIQSQTWSKKTSDFYGRPHFSVVRDLANKIERDGNKAWFFTSLGTSHASFTDASLLQPWATGKTTGATVDAQDCVLQHANLAMEFLEYQHRGNVTGLLAKALDTSAFDEPVEGERMGKHPYEKHWQIHVAPSVEEV